MPSRLVPVLTIAALLALAWVAPTAGARPGGEGYIVVLKDRVDSPGEVANDHERRYEASVEFVYRHALGGYAGTIPASRVDDVRSDSRVDYVERDGRVHTTAQTLPWGIDRIDADASSTLAGNGSGAVSNVNAYIIDTGIDRGHADLNAVGHVNFAGGPNRDCNGHGTHVAGTVAAEDNTSDVVGAAPGAPLTGVKVLGCGGSGSTSGVIKGVDWVTNNSVKPAIANMSLGGGTSTALDDAVKRSATSGVFYSLAAGNEGVDACNRSPARAGTAAGVVTTGATDTSNNDPSWSNFGSCVDIHAPGVGILSTRKGGGTTTLSGTSMAAPHVGGAGALYLSSHTGAAPATVESAIKSAAVSTGTTSNNGSPIKLLNVGGF
jgi:subtilisin family serine protease